MYQTRVEESKRIKCPIDVCVWVGLGVFKGETANIGIYIELSQVKDLHFVQVSHLSISTAQALPPLFRFKTLILVLVLV